MLRCTGESNANSLRNPGFLCVVLIMHSGKLVFAQLIQHLPFHTFRRYVQRNPKVKWTPQSRQ